MMASQPATKTFDHPNFKYRSRSALTKISTMIWPIFIKLSQKWWHCDQQNKCHHLTLRMQVQVNIYKNHCISADLNQILFKNDDAATGIVAFICADLHFYFYTVDSCFFSIDARHKPVIVCGSPLQFSFFGFFPFPSLLNGWFKESRKRLQIVAKF